MRLSYAMVGCFLFLVVGGPGSGGALGSEDTAAAAATQVIDLYRGRPIGDALDILRQRYHLAITYEDVQYVSPDDLADMTYTRPTSGPRIIVPSLRRLHFEYEEINGKPQEDITSLIRRLLREYAAQGGPVFDVRERTTPKGTEWNVVALKAHGSSGGFVDQPDILGAPIYIAKARRSVEEFRQEMLQQLRTETGYRVALGIIETDTRGTGELSADNVPAREALVYLFGTDMVWDLNYDPEGDGKYVLNLVWTPRPSQTFTAPTTLRVQPTGPVHVPIGSVMHWAEMPGGIRHIQSLLAQGGYYTGEMTGRWDENTVEAVTKGQAANNLPVTGELDPETIRKLGLDVITPPK